MARTKRRRAEAQQQQETRVAAAAPTGDVRAEGEEEKEVELTETAECDVDKAPQSKNGAANGVTSDDRERNGVHEGEVEEEEKTQEAPTPETQEGDDGVGGKEDEEDDNDDGGGEEEEDDVLVELELADFKNHPIFDDYASMRLEGIDTAAPMLHIGEYSLYGQLEETVGTHFFYDTAKKDGQYQYKGQTTKRIKFTIAPPTGQ